MTALSQLYPQPLWQWFEQICAIPHPSKHEQSLSQHIQAWAKQKQLDVVEDAVGNVIIRKAATPGMEDRKVVVIQAHIDMVPQKNADKVHDFIKDPIEAYVDGDWVKAKGTTLGADNGIGMASALAILGSDDIKHGPLEVLLTIDEEAGMTGAFGLQAGMLNAEILINTDSEQEGEIYMGCAGGVDAQITLPMVWQASEQSYASFSLHLSGLKGGHSGVNIHLGRGNANKILARFLFENADELALELTQFTGGSLRNAIPREANISFMLPAENIDALKEKVHAFEALMRAELAIADPDLRLVLSNIATPKRVMSENSQNTLIDLLHVCPNGVMRMSDEVTGVTETSLNVGVISTNDEEVGILCLIRSLIDSGRSQVEGMLNALTNLAGADVEFSGAYPGWKPDNTSPVMAIVRETYESIYHKEPVIMVIHAGLECGLFKKPYPEMDMVSIGPTIRYPHGPDEMVNITTVGQYWDLLVAVLERIPVKA
ncbi:aminoacyl-histidine dipeptidase [Shewanella oneidensis MR-1]|uniref:Cytosol non-specific dipeptidase n=1 Tax=Shewanella oneidensis (strain ATCC 700550 / JCM 31522 / CIP 106686 / LMG 19005 / NCIMB 14063 / MR-1) TaxID=211586 RepID=Q8EHU8_SHEON|nr:aminoacyl-histidine dipeptidase [Shewanella oneidensis]AAN54185.1 aminoacyl-histidine/glycine-aspartate dipeptidase PepD [Shewanella oneidensis MR-1]MDX5997020.1 aminoacyl-histidine dipeptidase [Shewanella oneidensis]MEE2028497.1 Cytosol non-specific dipeptidase [Shewanella oneidensis]QKG95917.1 aminoacyl-histidine dipeptidase [Shewanella oneidensis MR-1]